MQPDTEQLMKKLHASLCPDKLEVEIRDKFLALEAEISMLREKITEELANDVADIATIAMQRAWQLGQIYWQQADSDSYIQNRKADVTESTYWQARDDVRLAIITAINKRVTND